MTDKGAYLYSTTSYANPHAATSIGGIAYTYDNNGNLTAVGSGMGSTAYTWDWRDRLTQTATGTATTTYSYDQDNMRVRRTVKTQAATATTTFPSQYWNYTDAGTTTAHIFLPDGTPIATVEANGNATSTYWLHLDHLGGIHTVTNGSGVPVQTVDYYPYGDQRIASSSSAFDEQRKFTGHEYDSDSDLTYAKLRYLDQDIGRWFAIDPILKHGVQRGLLTDPQQLNSYSYGRNNPITYIDSTGAIAYAVAKGIEDHESGTHVFIVLQPDNPGDFGDTKIWTLGGYTRDGSSLVKGRNDAGDVAAYVQGYSNPSTKQGERKSIEQIKAPEGMSDTELIKSIQDSYDSYNEDAQYDPWAQEGVNSNNFATELIESARAKLPWKGNAPGIDPGYGTGIPDNYAKSNGQVVGQGVGQAIGGLTSHALTSALQGIIGQLQSIITSLSALVRK
jgi:RHS repeat-associated protein